MLSQLQSVKGLMLVGVVAIFTYELPKAEKTSRAAGLKLVTLSNYTSELIKVAKVQGYITADGLQLFEKIQRKSRNLAKTIKI